MEPYIQISKINDFVYCPMSLYLHGMYEGFSQRAYHARPQVVGKINHEAIMSNREEIYTYVQGFYRFIMNGENNPFPVFTISK